MDIDQYLATCHVQSSLCDVSTRVIDACIMVQEYLMIICYVAIMIMDTRILGVDFLKILANL